MKFLILEDKLSTEIARLKKLFIKAYRTYLSNKPRKQKLDVLEEIILSCLDDKTDLKLLIIRLNENYSRGKKREKE